MAPVVEAAAPTVVSCIVPGSVLNVCDNNASAVVVEVNSKEMGGWVPVSKDGLLLLASSGSGVIVEDSAVEKGLRVLDRVCAMSVPFEDISEVFEMFTSECVVWPSDLGIKLVETEKVVVVD